MKLTESYTRVAAEKPTMVRVAPLWKKYKRSPWDCGSGTIWPEDFVTGEWDQSNDPEAPKDYLEAAQVHRDTIDHWVKQFTPFKGKEKNIPANMAIVFEGDLTELADGFHRLTAAVIAGLKALPAVVTQDFASYGG